MARFREGDLFAIPLPDGDWATGRILLDVDRVLTKGLVQRGSPFRSRKGTILVEVYSGTCAEPSDAISATLIPGEFIDPDAILGREKPRWPIVGHRPIDPTAVEFPENVFNVEGGPAFATGEIEKSLPVPSSDVDRIECRTVFLLAVTFVHTVNHYLGRKQHIGSRPNMFTLDSADLRFNEHRDEVFGLMQENPKRSYFEWATSLGLNPARLWA